MLTKKDLLLEIKELTDHTIKAWKELVDKEPTIEDVKGFKDGLLIPYLEKVTLIAGNAIIFDKKEDLGDILTQLGEIYSLAGDDNEFNFSDEKNHLSYTLPSKEVIKHLYILGSLAVLKRKVSALKQILELKIRIPEKQSQAAGAMIYVVDHLLFDSQSGEGDMYSFFDESRKKAIENGIFFEWFYKKEDNVLNYFLRFDFLRSLFLNIKINEGERHIYIFPNFMRFYTYRVLPILREIATSNDYKIIFGDDLKEKIIKLLDQLEKRGAGRYKVDWSDGAWKIIELGYTAPPSSDQ